MATGGSCEHIVTTVAASAEMVKPTTQVADKAVSTEDLCNIFRNHNAEEEKETVNTAMELIRLEAVLAALVKSKVVAIKASEKNNNIVNKKKGIRARSHSDNNHHQCCKQQRLTSTSTASSSHKDHHHHHRHHHHHHHRKRQSDSALLASGLFPKKRHRHHHHHHHHHHQETSPLRHTTILMDEDRLNDCYTKVYHEETTFCAGGSTATLAPAAGPSTEDGAEAMETSPYHSGYHNYNYTTPSYGHHHVTMSSSRCASPSPSQSRMVASRYDEAYVAVDMEQLGGGEVGVVDVDGGINEDGHFEEATPQRKKKRKRRRKKRYRPEDLTAVDVVQPKRVQRLDPDDLPKRARWTIIATAFLLLLMSVLLVGVTLRMAPIIDEMVRKENEEHLGFTRNDEKYKNLPNSSSPSSPAPPTEQTTTSAT